MLAVLEKAKLIRLFILDVDGVLTSGLIYYDELGRHCRAFHVHDGLGIEWLQKMGIAVAVISSKKSVSIQKRLSDLQMKHIYLGYDDKRPAYEALKTSLNLTDAQIAYMGDDLPDLPLLRRAGLSFTVPHAPPVIQQQVDKITTRQGGCGAVREACEFILTAQGHEQAMVQFYVEE